MGTAYAEAKSLNESPKKTADSSIFSRDRSLQRIEAFAENTYRTHGPFRGTASIEQAKRGSAQMKLKISQPGDEYEEQANNVAQRIFQNESANLKISSRRDEAFVAKGNGTVFPAKEGRYPTSEVRLNPEALPDSLHGSGEPLPPSSIAFFERRFGYDFGRVRIHADARATESAQRINAYAYTLGENIVFDREYYHPGSVEGRKLLAHELTHVVQQGNLGIQQPSPSGLIQRGLKDAAVETAKSGMGLADLAPFDPLSTVFEQVVLTNVVGASKITIPDAWQKTIMSYAAENKVDGAILLRALIRFPSYYNGGWILKTQKNAKAMTLDRAIFVDGNLPLSTYVHELVHVEQYGVLGRTPFLVAYFGSSAAVIAYRWAKGESPDAMKSSPLETQAYSLEDRFRAWYFSKYGVSADAVSA